MKILIYGAGVIGSLYAVLLTKAGVDVSIYARGRRLETLKLQGLLYYEKGIIKKQAIRVTEKFDPQENYDFIILAVRENQLYQALSELKAGRSNIVTLVNSIDNYQKWEEICGSGRIIPAFPGAGGSFRSDVLDAGLTPAIIQPTTFGEISGVKSERTDKLSAIFRKAKIPYQIVGDMHLWQLCHLAMVVPIADAYYEAEIPERAGYDYTLMMKTAERLRQNFRLMKERNGQLSPAKMKLFLVAPLPVIATGLALVFKSSFGDKFMYQHSMKAPDEMRELHKQLYEYLGES